MSFAGTPEPPYYAVIFTTMRVNDPKDGYAEMSERLEKMVCDQPNYIGTESVRVNDGFSYAVPTGVSCPSPATIDPGRWRTSPRPGLEESVRC